EFLSMRNIFRNILKNPSSNWYQLIMSLWTDIDPEVRKTFFENFIVNTALLGYPKQIAAKEKYGCNIPWAILMDPTSACNLNCTGCWAAEYGNKLNMSYETLDSIIDQANELGTYMFLYSGGEPMVRKKDIIKLCEAHPDSMFTAFTNGTLIDEEFADEMLRVKNLIPAFSIEGFEEATDFRRGEGTYQAVVKAMEILKKKKLPFGISCCYTSKNAEVIGSEEYIDDMIAKGAKFAWFFTYMPVGKEAVQELLATAEQRKFMYHQIRKFRETKPIFTMDFWNDAEFIDGCIAGGRRYLHINANGDIEPCAFIHYSDSNIHEKTLLQTYQSPLFMEYHNNQPFNNNHLRPCPLLDNPGKLSEMIEKSGAKSTDLQNPENVNDLSDKCKDVADKWAPVAEKIWNKSRCSGCSGCAAN
ncbi:radical SAM protein, partial [Clostridium sp.]|uniref:radical SAM protein n=1 Tax=Clostridium sp. TaxID=1506 RepID=UPI00258ECA48